MANKSEKREDKRFFKNLYSDPFQSPRASAKHAFGQVNGETQQSQSEIITQVQMRKRS
ncbi:YpzG family protein [Pontibacillus salipaludis]|uniref:YpzG family protein n=1 Tax=Pontibacillus salipaludis TaxID=1697394 RepID=UPI0031ED7074